MYDFERDAVISAAEAMLLHGMPAPDLRLDMFSCSTLATAIGECMAGPSIGTILLAVFLNDLAPWHRRA